MGREREARTHEARAGAYAQLVGAIEAFDGVLFQARAVREAGLDLDSLDTAEPRETRGKMRDCLGPTVLQAPEDVRRLISDATLPRLRLATTLLDPDADQRRARPAWDAAQHGYRVLRARMRLDLGFDAEPAGDAVPAGDTDQPDQSAAG